MGLGRSQSRVKALAEKYIYLISPEASRRIDELENALAKERAKPVEVREVIKEVPSPHNIELQEKLNAAMREIGALKAVKPRFKIEQEKETVKVELKEIVREVPRIVFVKDKRFLALGCAASSVATALVMGLMILFLK